MLCEPPISLGSKTIYRSTDMSPTTCMKFLLPWDQFSHSGGWFRREVLLEICFSLCFQSYFAGCNWEVCLWLLAGPGLAIRVLCATEPYMERDYAETAIILKIIVDYANAIKKVIWNTIFFLIGVPYLYRLVERQQVLYYVSQRQE